MGYFFFSTTFAILPNYPDPPVPMHRGSLGPVNLVIIEYGHLYVLFVKWKQQECILLFIY